MELETHMFKMISPHITGKEHSNCMIGNPDKPHPNQVGRTDIMCLPGRCSESFRSISATKRDPVLKQTKQMSDANPILSLIRRKHQNMPTEVKSKK
jgi:hypothetical protein